MVDARYKIVQDSTKRSGIYIVRAVFEIVGTTAGCSAHIAQGTICTAQAAQNDNSLSSRYPHRRQNYLWAIFMDIITFCFVVMDVTLQLDMVWARLIINAMQFKKISSIQPRRAHESTLRNLIVFGLYWEETVVGVIHGHASHLLNRLDAMSQKHNAFRITKLNSNQFLFGNYWV